MPRRSDACSRVSVWRGVVAALYGGQLMIAANRADAAFIPGVASPGLKPQPIQGGSNLVIGKRAGHPPQDFNRFQICAAAVPTGKVLLHPKLGVPAAGPVNQQHDLTGGFIHIGNDLLDQNPNDPLLQPHVRRW